MQNNEFIFERENNFKNLSLSKEKLEHNIFNINLIMFGQIHRNKKIFFLPSKFRVDCYSLRSHDQWSRKF